MCCLYTRGCSENAVFNLSLDMETSVDTSSVVERFPYENKDTVKSKDFFLDAVFSHLIAIGAGICRKALFCA